jgi:hypothetical protein
MPMAAAAANASLTSLTVMVNDDDGARLRPCQSVCDCVQERRAAERGRGSFDELFAGFASSRRYEAMKAPSRRRIVLAPTDPSERCLASAGRQSLRVRHGPRPEAEARRAKGIRNDQGGAAMSPTTRGRCADDEGPRAETAFGAAAEAVVAVVLALAHQKPAISIPTRALPCAISDWDLPPGGGSVDGGRLPGVPAEWTTLSLGRHRFSQRGISQTARSFIGCWSRRRPRCCCCCCWAPDLSRTRYTKKTLLLDKYGFNVKKKCERSSRLGKTSLAPRRRPTLLGCFRCDSSSSSSSSSSVGFLWEPPG